MASSSSTSPAVTESVLALAVHLLSLSAVSAHSLAARVESDRCFAAAVNTATRNLDAAASQNPIGQLDPPDSTPSVMTSMFSESISDFECYTNSRTEIDRLVDVGWSSWFVGVNPILQQISGINQPPCSSINSSIKYLTNIRLSQCFPH